MARTADKVRSLIAEDSAFEDALSVVLSRAGHASPDEATPDGGTQPHTVTWGDVSDELTSGQWGRLIEVGILTDADGSGFAVNDPDGVREALSDDAVEASDDDDEESSWTTYDKLAGLGALALFPAYWFAPIRNAVGGAVDLFLGPLDAILPFYAVVIVLSVLTGLYSTLLQANLMNTEKMSAVQEKMSNIQERRKEAKERGDDAALERIQEEQMDAMSDQLGMFKEQFRPMVWIMLLTIPAFVWMYWMIGFRGGAGHIAPAESSLILPIFGELEWAGSAGKIAGIAPVWLVWYFLCSTAFRMIIQKSLNIRTTPGS
ncbi:DUF106 domain-containing protein [Halococcus saccharolyticus]|uniref:Adk/cmk cluster protein n=1 Tax=Halococcus saccharolyticus DSM 5350 TaxID=1227455 RepID=M0MAV7_9EURY|nr:DUF106 domain-containing protein [Halococcus saccharolyticus]EMA42478.1 adk/cmk cluster protein [Halococcus saccharolyticus DSM 5350]